MFEERPAGMEFQERTAQDTSLSVWPVKGRLAAIFFAALACCYLVIAWNARIKILQGNADFTTFYAAGRQFASGQQRELYNLERQGKSQLEVLETIQSEFRFQDGVLPYIHPPFHVLWFLPLSGLSYHAAFLLWGTFSVVVFSLGLVLLASNSAKSPRSVTGLFVFGGLVFLPVFITLIQGQDSALVFLFLTLSFHDLKRSKEIRAGIWLSLVLQRFQYLPLILLVLLVKQRWKVLAGFSVGALLLLLISMGIVGPSGLRSYAALLFEVTGWVNRREISSQMHCLAGQFYAFWYNSHPLLADGITVAMSILLAGLVLVCWRGSWKPGDCTFDLQFAMLVVTAVVASPHVIFHDLSLLLLPGALIFRRTVVTVKGGNAGGESTRDDIPRETNKGWMKSLVWPRRSSPDCGKEFSEELARSSSRLATLVFVVCYPIMLATLIVFSETRVQMSVLGMLVLIVRMAWELRTSQSVRRGEPPAHL